MKYQINVKIKRRFKNVSYIMPESLQKKLLNATNFQELRDIWSDNKNYFKDVLELGLYPESLKDRCELVKLIKEDKAEEIKVFSSLKGIFVKLEIKY